MTFTAEQIKAIGGQSWTKADGTQRFYLNDWPAWIGLDVDRYRSGNVSHATLAGERISNAKAGRLIAGKVYWEAGQIRVTPPLADYADQITEAVTAEVAKAV